MARAYNSRCIVLSHTKLGETDVIVTMLDADGRQVRAVAKGLRKPGNRIGARLELFSVVDVLLHPGRSLDVVGEVRCVEPNAEAREGLEHSSAGMVIAEFCRKLTTDGAHLEGRAFDMTCAAYSALGDADAQHAGLIAAAHLMKMLAMQGLRPATSECALCGESLERPARFDIEAGGALCAGCSRGLPEQANAATIASWTQAALYSTFAELLDFDAAPTRQLLELAESWAIEHLSLRLKSMAFLKTLC